MLVAIFPRRFLKSAPYGQPVGYRTSKNALGPHYAK